MKKNKDHQKIDLDRSILAKLKSAKLNIEFIPKLDFLVFIGFAFLSITSLYKTKPDFLGSGFYLFVSLFYLMITILSYRNRKKTYYDFIRIRDIFTAPVMTEDGNSVILTFLTPSSELIEKMEKVKKLMEKSIEKVKKSQKRDKK